MTSQALTETSSSFASVGKSARSRLHISADFDALQDRLDQIAPLLRESAAANEVAARLVPAVERALIESGVYRIGIPVELGGYEFSPTQVIETVAKVSYADASTGWVMMAVQMESGLAGGWLSEAAARRYFPADGEFATFAGQGGRLGRAVQVDGGYRLYGSWQFASGMHQASHIHTGALVEQTGEPRIFHVPKDQATLLDNWNVMGLRATGSIDYVIDDVFVPEANTYSVTTMDNVNGGTIYRLGLANMACMCHSAWAIGVGRRVLDEMKTYAQQRSGTPNAAVDTDHFHAAFADAEAKFRAARALVFETWAANETTIDRGELLDVAQETHTRLALNHVTWVVEEVTSCVYKWAATTALRDGALQRLFRDVHAGTQHITSGPVLLQQCGRQLAGLVPDSRWEFLSLVND